MKSIQFYDITCRCGKICSVAEEQAGTQIACTCGLEIDVPSLGVLRRQYGLSTASPELAMQILATSGEFTKTPGCYHCGEATNIVCYICIECDREVTRAFIHPIKLLISLLASFILPFVVIVRQTEVYGDDRTYHLPMKLCESCQQQLKDEKTLKKVLHKIPTINELFRKYPKVRVALLEQEIRSLK